MPKDSDSRTLCLCVECPSLFVMYVLMSVVIQPSWLPNPIKLIIIITPSDIHSLLLSVVPTWNSFTELCFMSVR